MAGRSERTQPGPDADPLPVSLPLSSSGDRVPSWQSRMTGVVVPGEGECLPRPRPRWGMRGSRLSLNRLAGNKSLGPNWQELRPVLPPVPRLESCPASASAASCQVLLSRSLSRRLCIGVLCTSSCPPSVGRAAWEGCWLGWVPGHATTGRVDRCSVSFPAKGRNGTTWGLSGHTGPQTP